MVYNLVMSTEDIIQLNIAYKTPTDVSEAIIDLSQRFNKDPMLYPIIDGVDFYPHVTIYFADFPNRNFEKIIETTKKLVRDIQRQKLIFKELTASRRYIDVEFEKSKSLQQIHETALKAINPFRKGYLREKYKDESYLERCNETEKENIVKYGYRNAMSLYRPHITITRFETVLQVKEAMNKIKWDIPEFEVDTLAVYEMGEHGTCKRELESFQLCT